MAGPLITAGELLAALDADDPITLLDVRYFAGGPPGEPAYLAGHLPGAVFINLDTDLASAPGPEGRHPLPEQERFLAAMRRAGVGNDRPVVVYDDWAGHAAARCWWLLRHYGHTDVRVLDGGLAAWREAGGPLQEGRVTGGVGDFTGTPGSMPVTPVEEVPDAEVLVDVRAAERYRGEVEPLDPVAGHIPGAVNLPTALTLAQGRFLPADRLRELYAARGAVPGADVTAYCGSGVTAAHAVLAMQVAGIEAALYPGSWSGWITDPARGVATG